MKLSSIEQELSYIANKFGKMNRNEHIDIKGALNFLRIIKGFYYFHNDMKCVRIHCEYIY